MKTVVKFTGSVWKSYYTEVNIRNIADNLKKEMYDESFVETSLNTITITKPLWPDDIKKLVAFLEKENVWNHIATMNVNIDDKA